jgi:hypothetical protein
MERLGSSLIRGNAVLCCDECTQEQGGNTNTVYFFCKDGNEGCYVKISFLKQLQYSFQFYSLPRNNVFADRQRQTTQNSLENTNSAHSDRSWLMSQKSKGLTNPDEP